MKHRGRYVGILLLLLTLVIVGCSTDNSPTVSSEQATASSEQPITTLELATAQRTITYEDGNYIYVPEEDSRTFDEKSNILFFNDLLKVHLIQDISTEEKEAIAQSVNGSLVGNYNDGINFIQIEVPAFTLKEFKKIQKKLYQNSNI